MGTKNRNGRSEQHPYRLSPSELDELQIPLAMQAYLEGSFRKLMHFTTDEAEEDNYRNSLAPMEGFEKKM